MQALALNTTGTGNVAMGAQASLENTTGTGNLALGNNPLYLNTTGSYNIALGYQADYYNNSATSTVAIGYHTGYGNGTYHDQGGTYVGYDAGGGLTTGSDYNTLIGYTTAPSLSSGAENTAVGLQAGYDLTTGSNNLLLGDFTTGGVGVTTGSNNILLGYDVRPQSQTGSNQLNIGNLIYGTGLGSGSTLSTGNVGIGTSTPWGRLSITGADTSASTAGFVVADSNNKALLNVMDNGNVGIGTTTPQAKFVVAGLGGGNAYLSFGGSGSGYEGSSGPVLELTSYFGNDGPGYKPYGIFADNSGVLTIQANGSSGYDQFASTGNFTVVGSGTTCTLGGGSGGTNCTSDKRLKTNITPISGTDALTKLALISGVTYNWADPSKDQSQQVGVIAQAVQQAFPQLVGTATTTFDGVQGSYLTVDYAGLVAPLISAVNELYKELTNLANTVAGFATIFHTQELCVGSTCVTPQQFQAMVAAANQSGTGASGTGSSTPPPSSSSGAAASSSTDSSATPPVLQVNGDNPAIIQVGATYTDLGATITGPTADLNLCIVTYVNGAPMNPVQLDTTEAATDTIQYVATDQSGRTATSTRTVVVAAPDSADDSVESPQGSPTGSTPVIIDAAPSIVPPAAASTTTQATSTAQ